MRACVSVLILAAALLVGCSDGVDRWSGSGCQPACVNLPGTGEDSLQCLDEGHDHQTCLDQNMGFPTCTTGRPTCDNGKPRCLEDMDEKPACSGE